MLINILDKVVLCNKVPEKLYCNVGLHNTDTAVTGVILMIILVNILQIFFYVKVLCTLLGASFTNTRHAIFWLISPLLNLLISKLLQMNFLHRLRQIRVIIWSNIIISLSQYLKEIKQLSHKWHTWLHLHPLIQPGQVRSTPLNPELQTVSHG